MLSEADSIVALDFLRAHQPELCGPDLMFLEVASVIVRRANENKGLRADALAALNRWTVGWDNHMVRPYPLTPTRLQEAGKLAIGVGHPLKDCIYLALAIELDCELRTCDARFLVKAKLAWPKVRMLRDDD